MNGCIVRANSSSPEPIYIYRHTQSSGFFANCSTALTDIAILRKAGLAISKIDFSLSMLLYKKRSFSDNYDEYFSGISDKNLDVMQSGNSAFSFAEAALHYRDLPLRERHVLSMAYFAPHARIWDLAQRLKQRLHINPENTIAIYYRGTDKAKEIKLADAAHYVALVQEIDRQDGGHQTIFLQTDDAAVWDVFSAEFGDRLKGIAELPMSRSKIGLHKSFIFEKDRFDGDRQASYLFASMLMMAECRRVIMTTSNVALWVALYRGHAEGLYQFDAGAELIRPYQN